MTAIPFASLAQFPATDSLTLSTFSSVLPDFGQPLFPLCISPIDIPFLNLRTILAMVFLCGGLDT